MMAETEIKDNNQGTDDEGEEPFLAEPPHPSTVPWEEYKDMKESYKMMHTMYQSVVRENECTCAFIHWMHLDRMYNVFEKMFALLKGDLSDFDYDLI